MGRKKGKSHKSSESQTSQLQAQAQPSQSRPPSQPQAPPQTQARSSQGGSISQPQNQGQTSQSQPSSQQQSARPRSGPAAQEKQKKDDSKAASSAPWVAEYTSVVGPKQNGPEKTGSTSAPSAWGSNIPALTVWGTPVPKQNVPQQTAPALTVWGTPAAPSQLGTKQQPEQGTSSSLISSQAQPLQQQSGRSKSRRKVQEKPPKDDAKACSSSHKSEWVAEYIDFGSSSQAPDKPDVSGDHKSGPQSQQESPHKNKTTKPSRGIEVPSSSSAVIPTSVLRPLPLNKGPGTRGRQVTVDVNFLPLSIEKLLPTVYQYDVTIEPGLPKRMLPHIFETYRRNNYKDIFIAFDGKKIAVSPRILPVNENIQQETKVIDENGRERVYMVAMKEAHDSEINFQSLRNYTSMRQYDAPLRAMQMLEIVLKAPFLDKRGVQAGRSFYLRPEKRIDLGDNYELWTGLFQATILGSRPFLNVDIVHKAFPSDLDVCEILRSLIKGNANLNRELQSQERSALQSHLNGLMIRYKILGNDSLPRTFKFIELMGNSKNEKFKNDQDKREYTIESYFRSRQVTIRYPLLPTLKLGNAIKSITVPMEFCMVPGNQVVNKKCTEIQTRNMVRNATTSTDTRKAKIMYMLSSISHNQSPTLKQFGVGVGNAFSNVPARILNAPTLQYKDRSVIPTKGQWSITNIKTSFLEPVKLTKYAVLTIDRNTVDVRQFCHSIHQISSEVGMKIDPNYIIWDLRLPSRNKRAEICECMSQMMAKQIELLFVVIPIRGDYYGVVKQCAELECGILTQCIKVSTLSNKGKDRSTVTNILLKVNAKLNGTNHKFADISLPPLMKKKFMLIGADVTHPSPGQEQIPSVVGVVASHDIHGFQYNKCWRLQDPKQEMISDFDKILKEQLKFYEKENRQLPDVILYFRDGVSEGQFQKVLSIELNAMYRGCGEYKQGYKPKITFIVVQKRHHTRFFPPTNSGLGRDDCKNNNVPPGTIVDSHITHPNETQFYLVSHQAIQGVARPTKYCLLSDDSNYSVDELQEITYNLCHFFARCTRTVSYPAPTYYAHLAAARGRVYIEGRHINMSKLDTEFKNRTVKLEITENHPMYFI